MISLAKNKFPAKTEIAPENRKQEQLSIAGIGNAALGTLAADAAKEILKKVGGNMASQNASKRDLQELTNAIQQMTDLINKRYFLIHGQPRRYDGAWPHFDMGTSSIVYLINKI